MGCYIIRVSVCVLVIFSVRIKVAVYVLLRRRVKRIPYDLYRPYFLPEVTMKLTRKATGHFVTLIKVRTHLIECTTRHNHFTSQCIKMKRRLSAKLPFFIVKYANL